MSSGGRYVFDTNTLISAALFERGKPGRAFRHALRSGTVLLSQATFEEIDEVLARQKFDHYLTIEERAVFVEALVERGVDSLIRARRCTRAGTQTTISFWSWQWP